MHHAMTSPEMDVRTEIVQQLADGMSAKLDDLIREAVTRFLGRSDWAPQELRGRCVRQVLPDQREVYCLDGVDILEVLPPAFWGGFKGLNVVLTGTRQHRFLACGRGA